MSTISAAAFQSESPAITHINEAQNPERIKIYEKYEKKISTLPKEKGWITDHMYKYQGFWYQSQRVACLEGVMAVQDNFRPHPTDILLACNPKSGTGWLKALAFAITTRTKYKDFSNHPLLTTNPRYFIPLIEISIFKRLAKNDYEETTESPRLLASHIPYTSLPESFLSSGCRIVYICRNPKDVLVSRWVFFNKLRDQSRPPITLEDAFDMFTRGVSPFGPFWDHVLGYHKASVEHPEKILFLKYEELKKDPIKGVKRMAEFMGHPFSQEEEAEGVVEGIIQLCSFEKMSSLEVNKNRVSAGDPNAMNHIFFRKGIVGDSTNHLTPEMIQIIDQISNEKLGPSNITF